MKTKKLANFQIYISAPLNVCPGNVNEKKKMFNSSSKFGMISSLIKNSRR